MSAEHATSYTADGPNPVGFRTGGDGTGIGDGVVATGTHFGVQGIGAESGVVGESNQGFGVRGKSQNQAGVFGKSDFASGVEGTSKTTGVRGVGDLIGVRGESDVTGIHGVSNQNGTGVRGESEGVGVDGHSGNGSGVRGSSENAYGGVFTSNFAQIRLEPVADPFGPPNTGSHKKGEFFVDGRGALFYCVGGSPPSWQRLAGPSLFREFISALTNLLRVDP
jgi:hypothetical protein